MNSEHDPNRVDPFAESQKRFDQSIARLKKRHEALMRSRRSFRREKAKAARKLDLKFAQTRELINKIVRVAEARARRLDDSPRS